MHSLSKILRENIYNMNSIVNAKPSCVSKDNTSVLFFITQPSAAIITEPHLTYLFLSKEHHKKNRFLAIQI